MIVSVKHLFTKSNTLQGKCAKAAYTKTHLRWRFYDIHETFYIHAFIFWHVYDFNTICKSDCFYLQYFESS